MHIRFLGFVIGVLTHRDLRDELSNLMGLTATYTRSN